MELGHLGIENYNFIIRISFYTTEFLRDLDSKINSVLASFIREFDVLTHTNTVLIAMKDEPHFFCV